jgi:hypothetical protein
MFCLAFNSCPGCQTTISRHQHPQEFTPPNQHTKGFFEGSVGFEPCQRIWKCWAPPRCKFFIWLATHNRCWTADCLARRGLDHPENCPLCDQEEEMMQHLLVSCVFTRQIWWHVFSPMGWQVLTPQPHDHVFQDWWRNAEQQVDKSQRKGFNSAVILVAWWLWKHRNVCVFEGQSSCAQQLFRTSLLLNIMMRSSPAHSRKKICACRKVKTSYNLEWREQ